MFHFYQIEGQILASDLAIFPRAPDIDWQPLFALDEQEENAKVAPIFPDAAAAVRWLREAMTHARQLPAYSRRSMPDFTTSPAENLHEAGMGALNNYGPLVGR